MPNAKNNNPSGAVPPTALSACPRIELAGNREAVIDGCRGVAEYSDTLIRLNISGGSVAFLGIGLEITCLYEATATLRGCISAVEFCI